MIAISTIFFGFLTILSAQTKSKTTIPKNNQVLKPKVSESVKAQVGIKISSGVLKNDESFVKDSKDHSQSNGHSKFGSSVGQASKVNVQKVAKKAKQVN